MSTYIFENGTDMILSLTEKLSLSKYLQEVSGSPGRIRTSDQPVNSRLLYH